MNPAYENLKKVTEKPLKPEVKAEEARLKLVRRAKNKAVLKKEHLAVRAKWAPAKAQKRTGRTGAGGKWGKCPHSKRAKRVSGA